MTEIDERKLKEPFLLQREQCNILIDGMVNMVQALKKYDNDLECKVLDDELSELIEEQAKALVQKEVNLKNTIGCISSTLGDMKHEFDQFQIDEDREIFCPNFEIQLDQQVRSTNESGISRLEMQNDPRLVQVKEIINELKEVKEDNRDEDFEEISPNTQLGKIPIDLFTQLPIVIPVRNKICRHVYDKEAVTNYINQRQSLNKTSKCPTIGCRAELTFNHLVEDNDLKEKIDRLRHNNA